jgi:hypothetical protein
VRFSPAAFERVRQRPMRCSGPSALGDSHLGRVGLDLMSASTAPYDQAGAGCGRAPERRGWAGAGFHWRVRYELAEWSGSA